MREGATLGTVAARTEGRLLGDPQTWISHVTHDSRATRAGGLFVAIRGLERDGHDFVPDAIERGAAAICVEEQQSSDIPQVVVEEGRVALARAAAAVYRDPSHEIRVVGITGTNGKTTVTHLLESIASHAGRRSGLIGTLGARIADRQIDTDRTTPEADDAQRLLRAMVSEDLELVAMEVSSHALALRRTDEIRFALACFTNFSQDHLDFHGNTNSYFLAKESLFRSAGLRAAVIWTGDAGGRRLAARVTVPTLRVNRHGDADVWPSDMEMGLDGSQFLVHLPDGKVEVSLPMVGDFNIDNALLAAACAHLVGFTPDEIVEGIGSVSPVPGRFALVSGDHPVAVFVDYAHTPDGIQTVLATAQALTERRVLVVFGAGGDRDRSKRRRMGEVAALGDIVIVTSDNPRSEAPEEIAAEVAAGVSDIGGDPHVVLDRRLAIREAIALAQPGDVVLILGKGHEQTQEIGGRLIPFDDVAVAREELGS
ncbi:MAG: UDP-N-acetylmuramoyl-L-alanyl-D-glutamate--2,6-diaminopimelate ligase [Acidimicrobiia bacterium]